MQGAAAGKGGSRDLAGRRRRRRGGEELRRPGRIGSDGGWQLAEQIGGRDLGRRRSASMAAVGAPVRGKGEREREREIRGRERQRD